MSSRHVAEPSRIRLPDLLGEAGASLGGRASRAVRTALGTIFAVALVVAVVGLASTAARQVAAAFGELSPAAITVRAVPPVPPKPLGPAASPAGLPYPFPSDAEARIASIPGVLATGFYWLVRPTAPPLVAAHPPYQAGPPGFTLPVVAASPAALTAARVTIAQGRTYDQWDQLHGVAACLLGPAAAARLGIARVDDQPKIYLNEVPCTVIGILASAPGLPIARTAVLIPSATATGIWGSPPPTGPGGPAILISATPKQAASVAAAAPAAISPFNPGKFAAFWAGRPTGPRQQTDRILRDLLIVLACVGFLLGGAVIALVTAIAIRARSGEIGLRRAAGARRSHIVWQIMAESALVGLVAGVVGTALGVAGIALGAVAAGWTPSFPAWLIVPAPFIGLAIGVLVGLFTALRRAHVEPAAALLES